MREGNVNVASGGVELRSLRVQLGLSLREMARRVFVDPSYLSKIEQGIVRPSESVIDSYVDALGLDSEAVPLVRDKVRLLCGKAPADIGRDDAEFLAELAQVLRRRNRIVTPLLTPDRLAPEEANDRDLVYAKRRNALIKSLAGLRFSSGSAEEERSPGSVNWLVALVSQALNDKPTAGERRRIYLKELFDLSGSVAAIQGTDHLQAVETDPFKLLPGEDTYPSDLLATAALNHWVFPGVEELVRGPVDPGKTSSLICVGSSVNNADLRRYFGSPFSPNRTIEMPGYRAELHWNFVAPTNRQLVSNWQAGRTSPWLERGWQIVSKEGQAFAPYWDERGQLRLAYLLVSRIPRDDPQTTRTLLSVAGTHGPGTLGLELVLRQLDVFELEKWIDRVQPFLYYQALFRVYDILDKSSQEVLPSGPDFDLYRLPDSFQSVATQIEFVDARAIKLLR